MSLTDENWKLKKELTLVQTKWDEAQKELMGCKDRLSQTGKELIEAKWDLLDANRENISLSKGDALQKKVETINDSVTELAKNVHDLSLLFEGLKISALDKQDNFFFLPGVIYIYCSIHVKEALTNETSTLSTHLKQQIDSKKIYIVPVAAGNVLAFAMSMKEIKNPKKNSRFLFIFYI